MARRIRVRADQLVVGLSDRLCECGCGQFTSVAPRTYAYRGVFRGDARRFVAGHQHRAAGAGRQRRFRLRVVQWRPPVRHFCPCGCGAVASAKGKFRRGHQFPWGPVLLPYVSELRSGCWSWILSVDGHGYPRMRRGGREFGAHRWFLAASGVDVDGLHVHHVCGNKRCVNPEHLRALSASEHSALHAREAREVRCAA